MNDARLKFLWSLLRHKWYVFKAGRLLKVPLWRLIIHDWSKFSPVEFSVYARWHHGPGKKRDKSEWARAWHHHQRFNPHHPEFYLVAWRGDPGFYEVDGIGECVTDNIIVLPMPEIYVREMIADLLGAGRAYTGQWNPSSWLAQNGPKMRLHPDTEDLVHEIMIDLGFFLTDNCPWSFMAGRQFQEWASVTG